MAARRGALWEVSRKAARDCRGGARRVTRGGAEGRGEGGVRAVGAQWLRICFAVPKPTAGLVYKKQISRL